MAEIDPDIAAFNARLSAAWRTHPDLGTLSPSEARAVAEAVRAPFARGGPEMARSEEYLLDLAGCPVRVRFHFPHQGGDQPGLIYLHGGGFTLFSIDTHDRLMREYAAAGGFAVIGVDYPLAPEHRYPVALDAVTELAARLAAKGEAFGIARGRLAIGGDSAGANLAVATCMRLRERGRLPIRAMLLNYGAFTGRCSDEAEARFGGPGAVLNRAEMDWFFGNYLGTGEAHSSDPFACPIEAELVGLPPAMLAIPDHDLLAEQSFAMAERFAAAGVPCETRIYPGATHSFLEAMASAPLAMRAIRDGAHWVRGWLD